MKLLSGSQVFRLLFNREAIEIPVDAYCQNCLSDKDITLKNHSAFLQKLLWFASNNMKLLSGSQVFRLLFNREAIEIPVDVYCQKLPLWQRYYAKKPLSLSSKAIMILHLTIWSFFLEIRFLGCFSIEKP